MGTTGAPYFRAREAAVGAHSGSVSRPSAPIDSAAASAMFATCSEWFQVPEETVAAIERCKAAGGRVTAVGTTTLRALESAAVGGQLSAGARETDIFITPGFEFQVVDRLVTNFHLPKSTLMMLVSAFAGYESVMALYRHAIAQRYRFFSYGDAMLLERRGD